MPSSLVSALMAAAEDVGAVGDTNQSKPWGRELSFMLDDCLTKVITVLEGKRTSLQRHEFKEEVIICLAGNGGVQDGDGNWICTTGQSIRITPGMVHRTVGPIILFEVQTNFPDDVIRISDDFGR